jgi:hypothetical protein
MPAYRIKKFGRIGRWKARGEIQPAWPEMIYSADAGEAQSVAAAREPHREVHVEHVPYFGLDEYRRERMP